MSDETTSAILGWATVISFAVTTAFALTGVWYRALVPEVGPATVDAYKTTLGIGYGLTALFAVMWIFIEVGSD